MNIYSGDVVSKDVVKSFRNLLWSGDGTSAKKLDEDLDILWASKGGNIDLSKWSTDDFSTGLIPDYIDCKYFASKHVATKNFGLCFAVKKKFHWHFLATTFLHMVTEKKFQSPVGACQKKLILDPEVPIRMLRFTPRLPCHIMLVDMYWAVKWQCKCLPLIPTLWWITVLVYTALVDQTIYFISDNKPANGWKFHNLCLEVISTLLIAQELSNQNVWKHYSLVQCLCYSIYEVK